MKKRTEVMKVDPRQLALFAEPKPSPPFRVDLIAHYTAEQAKRALMGRPLRIVGYVMAADLSTVCCECRSWEWPAAKVWARGAEYLVGAYEGRCKCGALVRGELQAPLPRQFDHLPRVP